MTTYQILLVSVLWLASIVTCDVGAESDFGEKTNQFKEANSNFRQIWDQLGSKDTKVAYRAIRGLTKSPNSVLFLAKMIKSSEQSKMNHSRLLRVIEVLHVIGSKHAQDLLGDLARHAVADVRQHARDALTIMGRGDLIAKDAPETKADKKPDSKKANGFQAINGRRKLDGHKKPVVSLSFDRTGRLLASASLDGTVCIWEFSSGKLLRRISAHKGGANDVCFAPDGLTLASAGNDDMVRLWNARTGKPIRVLKGHRKRVVCLDFSTDGRMLASGGYDKTILLWKIETDEKPRKLIGHDGCITSLAFAPNDKFIASAGTSYGNIQAGANTFGTSFSDFVRLWRVKDGENTWKSPVRGHCISYSPDGRTILTGGLLPDILKTKTSVTVDGFDQATLLDAKRKVVSAKITWRGSAVIYSPNGALLATANGNRLHFDGIMAYGGLNGLMTDHRSCLWDAESLTPLLSLPDNYAITLSFSPNGNSLVVGTWQDGAIVYNLIQESRDQCLKKHKLSESKLNSLWEQVGNSNPRVAYTAMTTLIWCKDTTVAFLRNRISTPRIGWAREFDDNVSDLASHRFRTRMRAFTKLKSRGWSVEPGLRKALKLARSAEVRTRIQQLLKALEEKSLDKELLNTCRAIRILERINSEKSFSFLQRIAQGPSVSLAVEKAGFAVQRMKKQFVK